MTKLRLSKKGFYLFNISLLIVGVIITGVGAANLLSGQVLSPHAMFKLWVVIVTFFFVAILALIWRFHLSSIIIKARSHDGLYSRKA